MVDIEADGSIPGDYSMVSFGAVVVEPGLERTRVWVTPLGCFRQVTGTGSGQCPVAPVVPMPR